MAVPEPAEAVGSGRRADQDITDDRRKPQPPQHGDRDNGQQQELEDFGERAHGPRL
jgi:hypothetical protein